MKKQIGICTLITMLVLVAVSCTRHPAAEDHPESATATVTESVTNTATEYITNTTFITAVEEATDINWTKEEDGTVRLTPENLKAIRAVKELDISNMELTDLSGIEWFTGLEDLGCTGNYLTELDVSKNTKLQNLYCYKNQLRSLDLSQNTALEELYCHENQLGLLDLSHNTALIELYCYNNQLRSLDLLQNTALTKLSCYNNQLTELDISHNQELEILNCGYQKTSNGETQELTLTLTEEQREKWDRCWADETDEDAKNAYTMLAEGNADRRGQVYPFDEIQLVFPDKFRLEYARELRVNDRHCKYYFTYGVCWVEAGYEESPFFCLVKEEDGKITDKEYFYEVVQNLSELETNVEKNGEPVNPAFFGSYGGSNFYRQLDAYKEKCGFIYILDMDNDGYEEIVSLFFGIYDWDPYLRNPPDVGPGGIYPEAYLEARKESLEDKWFKPKIFPYDFVEYKGKTGLRIVFYDEPESPTHYHAEFWAYDENTQQYEKLEQIWELEENTPPDGLIFAEARADLFWGSKTDFSKLNGRLTDEDLEDLDKVQLRIMRNAVYARHGRMFQSEDLQTLFNECSWYTKNPEYTDGLLTETDRYNIRLIQKYEDKQAMLTFDYKTIKAVEPETVAVEEGGIYRAKENIYLREKEDTSGEIITTIQTDTLVKVLSLGKEDTIDGIKSNWVQIEVQTGGWDSDGNPIKAGTTGWCFGGNLKIGEYEESELFVSPETANKIGSKVKNIFRICVEEIQRFMERYFFFVFSIILAVPFIYNTIKLIQSIKARKKDTQDNVPVPSRILIYIGYFSTLVAISFYILQTMALPSGIYVIFETLFNIGLFDSILAYVIAGLVTIAGKIRKKKETSGSLALVITGEVVMIVVILFFFALNLIFVMEYYYKNAMIALVVLEVGTMLITAGVLRPKVNKKEKNPE